MSKEKQKLVKDVLEELQKLGYIELVGIDTFTTTEKGKVLFAIMKTCKFVDKKIYT